MNKTNAPKRGFKRIAGSPNTKASVRYLAVGRAGHGADYQPRTPRMLRRVIPVCGFFFIGPRQ
jgi:hypothetical protein